MFSSTATAYAEMYSMKQAQAAAAAKADAPPLPTVRNSFEDPTQMHGYASTAYPPQQYQQYQAPQQQQQQQQPTMPPAPYSQYNTGYAQPYGAPAPSSTTQQGPYPPQSTATNPNYSSMATQQNYSHQDPYAPQPYQEQTTYTQQQAVAPPSTAPVAQQGAFPPQSYQQNPDVLQVYRAELRKTSERSKFLNDSSIPRMWPSDVEEDMKEALPAPTHITPVSRTSLRPTMSTLPATPQIADSIDLPIGLSLNPFAETQLNEVDFSEHGNRIIRCRKCSAYINPFTTFVEGGRRWQCILCRSQTDVPKEYFSPVDPSTGQRHDIMRRPELLHCSVDFYPTPEFLRRPPRRTVFLVMLDCSFSAVTSGLLKSMCNGVLAALEAMKEDDVMHMGVLGFDGTVYFFNLNPTLSAPRMMASPDTVNDVAVMNDDFKLERVELPCLISDLIVPVSESYKLLRATFEAIPEIFANTKDVGCAFGPALTAAITMLEESGGKLLTSIANIPSDGEGKLKPRFSTGLVNKPKEYTLCTAANDWYKQRALGCSNCSISIDIFAGSSNELDLTTIAPLARFTSGSIHRASPITMGGIEGQVKRTLTRFTAFDSVLRVRTSTGLIIPNFYGHCHVRQPDLVALAVADEDSSYSVEFSLGPKFTERFAYVQFAIVYTTRTRQRRIRVHTLQLPVSSSVNRVLNSINSIGMASFLAKMCVDTAVSNPFTTAQEKVTTKLVNALRTARLQMEAQGVQCNPQTLCIPTSMRFLPQLLNGFFRCAATSISTTQSLTPDERVASMSAIISCPPDSLVPFFVPWFYEAYSPYANIEQLPARVYASQSLITSHGVFLLHMGSAIIMWVGKSLHPSVAAALGIPPPNAEPSGGNRAMEPTATMEQLQALRERIHDMVWTLRESSARAFAAQVVLCQQGNVEMEKLMTRIMTEDAVRQLQSYGGFLTKYWPMVFSTKK